MDSVRIRVSWASIQVLLASLAILVTACDSTTKVVVENTLETQTNQPPTIAQQGPDFPPGGYELISAYSPSGIDLWVLVGDPDGVDDISLVAASVDSVRLDRYILRPDTSATCDMFTYADNETIATSAILAVPAKFAGFSFAPLGRVQGGLYRYNNFGGSYAGFPDLVEASATLVPWNGGCTGGTTGIIGPIIVVPPAVPIQKTAILSYADVRYLGIKVTVYDKVGATATTTFPDLRIVFTSSEERTAAP